MGKERNLTLTYLPISPHIFDSLCLGDKETLLQSKKLKIIEGGETGLQTNEQ